ncbi:MAG: VCBS repeat-containing protein [Flavobacteriales bacterium]|nr:T9SS type A sorting domain-containing protein [Flavobacteriales bacterium]
MAIILRSVLWSGLFFSTISLSLGQFAAGTAINAIVDTPMLQAMDLDGDGDLDLAGLYSDGFFKWNENTDGAGSFAPTTELIHSGGPSRFAVFADLDGDLDHDVVWYYENDSTVRVSYNNAGNFETPGIIGTLPNSSIGALKVADVNDTELPEIIVTLGNNGMARLAIYPNLSGVFQPKIELPEWFMGDVPTVLLAGDLDDEEGKDMFVINSEGLTMAALNTNGDGSLWTLDTLFQLFSYPYTNPQLIDVDGDGDLDIAEASNSVVQWAENILNTDPQFDAFNTHELEPFTSAGRGAFGSVGCGLGSSVVYVPANPQLPVNWDTYLPATNGFTGSVELLNVPRGSNLILADVNADGRDDIIMTTSIGAEVYFSIVEPPTTVIELPTFETYCKSGPPVQLPQGIPGDGIWSGPWVSNGLFYRSNVGFQTDVAVAYTVREVQGCPVAGLVDLHVVPAPIVEPVLGPVICRGNGPYLMTSVPSNTVWNGLEPGNILDPMTYTGEVINCVYEDPSGIVCGTVVGPFSVWNSISAELLPAGPFCVTDTAQQILPAIDLPNNNWMGDVNVTVENTAFFDPTQGAGEYTIVLQRNGSMAQECGATDTLIISVSDAIPQIDVAALPPYCAGQPVDLSGVTPEGGEWNGNGVNNGQLDPGVVGAGTHVVNYVYHAPEGCSNTADVTVEFIADIAVDWNADDLQFCTVDEPVQFNATPAGGVWSGDVTSNGVFDPFLYAEGMYLLQYTWTDVNGCAVASGMVVPEILPTTPVTITPVGVVCLNHPAFEIMGSLSGTWSGTVSGAGSSITFDPSAQGEGTWPVILTAQETGMCAGSNSINVVVDPCVGIEEISSVAGITLAPNPFNTLTMLTVHGAGKAQIDVRDATGRLVLSNTIAVQGSAMLPLDLSSGSNGTYSISVLLNGSIHYLKAVKVN